MKNLEYLDFDLCIEAGQEQKYPVKVLFSPAGEAPGTMLFPYDPATLAALLPTLKEVKAVREFGQTLFESLLNGPVRSLYDVSLNEASRQGKGLRLKLRLNAPELAALPWEFLYDPNLRDHLSLSTVTPVVRYMEMPQPLKSLSVTRPIRILGLTAAPTDLPRLNIDREKSRIETALAPLVAAGQVELTWLPGQTWRDLQQAIRTGPWHVLHFIGHGSFDTAADEGQIALADEDGATDFLSATALSRLLASHPYLRLVILNSCEGARGDNTTLFSSTASILVGRGMPAVLAMQYEISDTAAVELARTFYESLAGGYPVDAALAEARIAISIALDHTVEWGTPVLYMRAADGVLFQVEAGPGLTQVALPSQPTPAPALDLDPAARLAQLEGIIAATDQKISALRRQQAAASPQEQDRLARQYEQLKAQLDRDEAEYEKLSLDPATAPARSIPATPEPAPAPAPPAAASSEPGPAPAPATRPAALPLRADLVATLPGPTKSIASLAFSPDGKLLACGSADKTIQIWDMSNHTLRATLTGHGSALFGSFLTEGIFLCFSPDGHLLISGGVEGKLKFWDVASLQPLLTLNAHTDAVTGVVFSPDGKLLATSSFDNSVKIWDVERRQELARLAAHTNWVNGLTFRPDGKVLASASHDKTIRLWDTASWQPGPVLLGHKEAVSTINYSPDGQFLVSGSEFGSNLVRLWSGLTHQELTTLQKHTDAIKETIFSPDSRLLATTSLDKTINLWDTAGFRLLFTLEGHTGPLRTLAFSPDGQLLASGGNDKSIKLWKFIYPS